jgi:hypothetical protein
MSSHAFPDMTVSPPTGNWSNEATPPDFSYRGQIFLIFMGFGDEIITI